MAINPVKSGIEASLSATTRKVEQTTSSSTASGAKKDTLNISKNSTTQKPTQGFRAKIKHFFNQIWETVFVKPWSYLKKYFSTQKSTKPEPKVESKQQTKNSTSVSTAQHPVAEKTQPTSAVTQESVQKPADTSNHITSEPVKPGTTQSTSKPLAPKEPEPKTKPTAQKTGAATSPALSADLIDKIESHIQPQLAEYTTWLNTTARKKINKAYLEVEFKKLHAENKAKINALKKHCEQQKQKYGDKVYTSKYFRDADQYIHVSETPHLNTLKIMVKERRAIIELELKLLQDHISHSCRNIEYSIAKELKSIKRISNSNKKRAALITLKEKVSAEFEELKREVNHSKAAQASNNYRATISAKHQLESIFKSIDRNKRILEVIDHEIEKLPTIGRKADGPTTKRRVTFDDRITKYTYYV